MATAYSVFANGGYRVNPYLVTRITDHKDKVLVETQPPLLNETMRAIPQRNAFIMDSLLQEVARSGTAAKAQATLKRPDLYGKTGTTNDSLDAWFAGFQPTMTAVAWMGYDTPRKLGDRETGGGLSLPIWISFMETAIKGVPVTETAGAVGRGQRRRRVVLRRLRAGPRRREPGRRGRRRRRRPKPISGVPRQPGRRRRKSATASSTCSATESRQPAANCSGWPACARRLARQVAEEFLAGLGVDPGAAVVPVVVAAGARRQPDFLQRLLQVDDQLAAVAKGDRDHAAHALVVDIGVGRVVDAVAAALDGGQRGFGAVHVLGVGHYNFAMLNVRQILVSALGLSIAWGRLAGCGQKGPLYLPTDPAAKNRATLPQTC